MRPNDKAKLMHLGLNGKVALITGGTTGIGLAGALALAAEGAKVVVSGRRTREGEQAVITIREAGGLAEFVQADVSRAVEVQRLVEQTVGFWGAAGYADQ